MGSEMCIRDRRIDQVDLVFVPAVIPTGRGGSAGDRDATLLLLRHCLLYTSDAADDLLCVDLGGRRIIKKKKKNQHIK